MTPGRRLRTRAAVFLCAALLGIAARAAPFTPADDAQVVERLPAAGLPEARGLRELEAQLAVQPGNQAVRIELAQRYYELSTALDDARYAGWAAAVLEPVARARPDNPTYWLLAGQLQLYYQDFEGALESLDRAAQLDPEAAGPIAVRAAIHTLQGRYADALGQCTQLVSRAHPLWAHGCTAIVQASTGQLAPAYEALARAVAEGKAPPAILLWNQAHLGEMAARLGRTEQAQAHFREALQPGLSDPAVLAAYADFLLRQDRAAEAVDLLAERARSEALLVRLAIAARAAGDARAGEWAARMRQRVARASLRRNTLIDWEAAQFELRVENRPERALSLAARHWRKQKDGRAAETLLRAALAAGRPREARPVLAWLRETKYEDPVLAQLAQALEAAR